MNEKLALNRFDRWLLRAIIWAEMPKAKPADDKIARLLEKILAKINAMDDLSPELAMEIKETDRLTRKLDRMVPDRPTKKEQ